MQTLNNTNCASRVQLLAKLAVTRPEQAIKNIIADGDGLRMLQALRVYPQALQALWNYAPRQMKQAIEDELEAVGIQILT
jgi:hypothetical protein